MTPQHKQWPELETFNSHSTHQWSLAQQSDWQLIPNQWRLSDTSFLLLLVCLLTQAEAWHSDKKLTKSPRGKIKKNNKKINKLIKLRQIFRPYLQCKRQRVKCRRDRRALVMEAYLRLERERGRESMREHEALFMVSLMERKRFWWSRWMTGLWQKSSTTSHISNRARLLTKAVGGGSELYIFCCLLDVSSCSTLLQIVQVKLYFLSLWLE